MIIKEIFSAIQCDRCSEIAEGSNYTYYSDESDALENAWESGWYTPDGSQHKHYCSNCFIDKGDEKEILPAWPYHIKKLRSFLKMTRIFINSIIESDDNTFTFKVSDLPEEECDMNWIRSYLGTKLISIDKTVPNKYGSYYVLIKVQP